MLVTFDFSVLTQRKCVRQAETFETFKKLPADGDFGTLNTI